MKNTVWILFGILFYLSQESWAGEKVELDGVNYKPESLIGKYVYDSEKNKIGRIQSVNSEEEFLMVDYYYTPLEGRLASNYKYSLNIPQKRLEKLSFDDAYPVKQVVNNKLAYVGSEGKLVKPVFKLTNGDYLVTEPSEANNFPLSLNVRPKSDYELDLEEKSSTFKPGSFVLLKQHELRATRNFEFGVVDTTFQDERIGYFPPMSDAHFMDALNNPETSVKKNFRLDNLEIDSFYGTRILKPVKNGPIAKIVQRGSMKGPKWVGPIVASTEDGIHILKVEKERVAGKGKFIATDNKWILAKEGSSGLNCLRKLQVLGE